MTRDGFAVILSLISLSLRAVAPFTPLSKDEQIERFQKTNREVEPFRRNLTECARQVRASAQDVDNFLKRAPQTTVQGRCFVACILKRNAIVVKSKIAGDNLLEANRVIHGDNGEVMERLARAIAECKAAVEGVFEICEYASTFNDCMHAKMEHVLDKVAMERRMEALGQMPSEDDVWTDDEDEMMKLVRDEL